MSFESCDVKCCFLFLITFLFLKSVLFGINAGTLAPLLLLFLYGIEFHPLTFSVFVSQSEVCLLLAEYSWILFF